MNKLLSICTIAIATTLCTSCEDIYEGGQQDLPEVAVQLKAQIIPFEKDKSELIADNAKVGVYMVSSDTDTPIASNLEMPMNADGVIDTDNRLFYPKDGSKVNVFCYTPYVATASDGNQLSCDVSAPDVAQASDYLYASNRNRYMALAPIKVQLKHILSRALFDIKAGEGITDEDLAGISLTFKNLAVRADFNLLSGKFSISDEDNIQVIMGNQGHYGECFVIPCSVPNLIVACNVKGMTFTKKLGSFDFKSGNLYKFDIIVTEPGFDIVLRHIEDWKVEEY